MSRGTTWVAILKEGAESTPIQRRVAQDHAALIYGRAHWGVAQTVAADRALNEIVQLRDRCDALNRRVAEQSEYIADLQSLLPPGGAA